MCRGFRTVIHNEPHQIARFGEPPYDLRFVAVNVTMGIIPSSGHWIMDENPKATTESIVNFLSK
jgi:pimeloyl-ACP methyl ester carboxylesterase